MSSPGNGLLFALADGMGGFEHGAVASRIALEALAGAVFPGGGAPGSNGMGRRLQKGVEAANVAVCKEAGRLGAQRMGTTLTAAWISGPQLCLAHVGDSRAYLVRGGEAALLTSDHSVVGDLLRMGVISPGQVRNHARRSVLTRAVGLNIFVQPELKQVPLQPGDCLVMCSDGLWAVVEDEEIGRLAAQSGRADGLCRALLDLALQRHTDDNVSVIAVYIHATGAVQAAAEAPGNFFGRLRRGLKEMRWVHML